MKKHALAPLAVFALLAGVFYYLVAQLRLDVIAWIAGPRHSADERLAARMRAMIQETVSYPGAVSVSARRGAVTLSGPVLGAELDRLLARACQMRGATHVENRLEAYAGGPLPRSETDPAAAVRRPARTSGRLSRTGRYVPPLARALAGLAGAGMLAYGARRRDTAGAVLAPLGFLLFTRALLDRASARRNRRQARRHTLHLRKALRVNAPLEDVFAFWSSPENFPRFLSHLREVRATGAGQSHWVAVGPAGAPAEWDTVVTEYVPGAAMAWQSLPGAPITSAGRVRFEPLPDGATRVVVEMSYRSAERPLTEALSAWLGRHPQQSLDADLVRSKHLIEREAGRYAANLAERSLAL